MNPGIDFDNAPRYSTHSIGNLLASIHHQMRHQLQGKPFLSSSLTAPLLLDAPRVFGSILRALLKKNMVGANCVFFSLFLVYSFSAFSVVVLVT